jgi:transposase
VLFVGDDWAEAHHDIEIVDEDGRRLARRRLPEGVDGLAGLHALVADHLAEDAEPEQVIVGIETDRGPWVQALIAAGYTVSAVNPLQVARYRERHGAAGAKSDPGDAHVLAELVRLDRAHHRPIAGDSALAEHVKVLARTHQSMIWSRQRQTNTLRSMLREFYPRRAGRVRRGAGRPRCPGGPHDRTFPGGRATPVPGQDHRGAAASRPATQPAGHRRANPDRAARPATGRPSRRPRRLHRRGQLTGRGDQRAREADRGAARRGGDGFWPAPGR